MSTEKITNNLDSVLDDEHKKQMRYMAIHLNFGAINSFIKLLVYIKKQHYGNQDKELYEVKTNNELFELENEIIDFLSMRNKELVHFPEVFKDIEELKMRIVPFKMDRFLKLDSILAKALKNDTNRVFYNNDVPKIKDYKTDYWFIVGVSFAKGETPLNNQSVSAMDLAKKLGNKNYRPFISESISNTKVGNKNIFSSIDKMDKIIKYCKGNRIDVCKEFRSRCTSLNEFK